MRKAYPIQLRFDTVPIQNVALNLECRDAIVPVLRALQHVYANRQLTTSILDLIADDIIGDSRSDTGREGMDYWHICVSGWKPICAFCGNGSCASPGDRELCRRLSFQMRHFVYSRILRVTEHALIVGTRSV